MNKKVILDHKWFEVVEFTTDDGATMTGIDFSNDNVVVLPYTTKSGIIDEIGINYECNSLRPGNFSWTAVTGMVEDSETNYEAAIRELLEETGYNVTDENRWTYLGTLFTSKIITLEQPCYAVDVTDLTMGKKKGDGTKNEMMSKFELVPLSVAIRKNDCYILSLLMKLYVMKYRNVFSEVN